MISPICSKCAAPGARAAASGRASCSAPPMSASNISGLDGKTRTTKLHFDPRPTLLAVNSATYHFDLAPAQLTSLFVAVTCNHSADHKPVPFMRGLLAHRREMRRSTRGATSIETSNNIFNEVLCQSMADLNMLMTETRAWPLSLCRHPLVFDHVRPRRPDHRAADAVDRSARWPAACSSGSPPIRPKRSIRSTTPSPARSCMRCAAAKWRRCARCRSRNITAASIPRRCSCCSPASISNAPATRTRCANCGPRSRRRLPGSTVPAIPIATALSNISAPPNRASPTRAGRIPSTRSFMPTANWPKATSRCARCRATSSRESGWRRVARGSSA